MRRFYHHRGTETRRCTEKTFAGSPIFKFICCSHSDGFRLRLCCAMQTADDSQDSQTKQIIPCQRNSAHMKVSQSDKPLPRKPLRVWPGITLVAIQWFAWLV